MPQLLIYHLKVFQPHTLYAVKKDNVEDVGRQAIVFRPQCIYIPLSSSVGGAAHIVDVYNRMLKVEMKH